MYRPRSFTRGCLGQAVCLGFATRLRGIRMSLAIQHDRGAHRFEADVEGHRCELDYTLTPGPMRTVMTITHTGVPAPVGGRGIAAALVEAALKTARIEGWLVVPACSYAAVWMQRHAEYRDLLA